MFQQLVEKLKKPKAVDSTLLDSLGTGSPIIINIYDMYWINEYTTALGVGVYHTGVQVYGTEYAYGGHQFNFSGIFEIDPGEASELGENFQLKTSIRLGVTDFEPKDVRDIIQDLGKVFTGDKYHLLHNNCNHFAQELVKTLCGKDLPKWVNRLASVSSNIPFIEKALPKEWLVPLPLDEMQDGQHYTTQPYTSATSGTGHSVLESSIGRSSSRTLNLNPRDCEPPPSVNPGYAYCSTGRYEQYRRQQSSSATSSSGSSSSMLSNGHTTASADNDAGKADSAAWQPTEAYLSTKETLKEALENMQILAEDTSSMKLVTDASSTPSSSNS